MKDEAYLYNPHTTVSESGDGKIIPHVCPTPENWQLKEVRDELKALLYRIERLLM